MIHLALTAMTIALSAPIPATTPASPAPVRVSSARSDATRYCVVETFTGSRIPTRVCHTRAEWLDRGSDPLARN